ncbi:MAG TPA: succinate dehydrogenase/fumarate reductase iron-sulfur subunit [Bacteroidales bacterium]|jgi:succinate dehydrogenase / fumarate reductase iron-sulfur subunit|nr:succinate dehydrogenase/fumarate reductase iron-sulfur subunit [Bacteroidales bacterium]
MAEKILRKIKLKIWRQENAQSKGYFDTYELENISTDASFLEMMDLLNEHLIMEGIDPVAFDHDCREGICGSCGLFINGRAHGPDNDITTCQLHMRKFREGATIVIEPWRAKSFPVIKDLMVDRSAFDIIQQAGGFITINTGSAVVANTILIDPKSAETAMDAASCIGCGACVAACKNSSAMLFVAAKVTHLANLPQGKPEAKKRAIQMAKKMDELGFGGCSNTGACEVECPKNISISTIATLNREYLSANVDQ